MCCIFGRTVSLRESCNRIVGGLLIQRGVLASEGATDDETLKEDCSMQRGLILTVIGAMLMLMLVSCGGSSPGDVIEAYLAAVVAKDEVTSVRLSCLAWEEQARAEGAAFDANEVVLKDVSCQTVQESGNEAIVTCTGSIRFSYDGGVEETLDLEGRSFRTVFEDDEWKMCGYQ
jgi:hypothetical protein